MRVRILILILLGVCMLQSAFAQFSLEPNHEIYDDIALWEGAGYIRQLPPIRPFPLATIKNILETVIAKAPPREAEKAQRYLTQITHQRVDWGVKLELQTQTELEQVHWKTGAGTWLQGFIGEHVSYGTDIMLYISPSGENGAEALPRQQRSKYDLTYDITSLGSSFQYYFQVKSSATFGRPNLYFQTGIMRRSFGPSFNDSIVYSKDTRAAPGFVFYWRGKLDYMAYTAAVFMLEATSLYERQSSTSQVSTAQQYIPGNFGDVGGKQEPTMVNLIRNNTYSPNKFMHLHMLSFYPLPWLEFGFFESIVWGPRFDLKYFLPFKILYHLQSAGNFPDNTLIGLYFDFRAGENWKFPIMLYVDDINLTQIIQLNPKARFKTAFQAGIQWTPNRSWIQSISLEYMLATPYMYTHSNTDDGPYTAETNYTNYTHFGQGMASLVRPNSDRLTLRLHFAPVPQLNIEIIGRFMQYANASEGKIIGPDGTSGTIWDPGYYTHYDETKNEDNVRGAPSFHNDYPPFLGQSIIERTVQFGLNIAGDIPTTKFLHIAPKIEYTFEYVMNKNLEEGNNVMTNYINVTAVFSFFAPRKQ